jgi:hypothetical protein
MKGGVCKGRGWCHRLVTVDGNEDVPPYNELALKKAVSK